MTLHVDRVANPPAGTDWTYKVPGQYIERLVAVTGILTTGSATPTLTPALIDSSPHARNGHYVFVNGPQELAMLNQAGAIVDDAGVRYPGGGANNPHAESPDVASPFSIAGDYSYELWVNSSSAATEIVFGTLTPGGGIGLLFQTQNGTRLQMFRENDGLYNTNLGVLPADGAWHHVVFTFALAGNFTCYVDGAAVATANQVAPGSRGAGGNATHYEIPGGVAGGGNRVTSYDEAAFYTFALSAGQVAAHYAARGSIAAYTAAVLADSPEWLYHMDERPAASNSPAPILTITDSTSTVLDVAEPTGQAQLSVVTYNWLASQSNPSVVTTTNGITLTLPVLILPAGYTVGAVTPGLGPTDQWSAVTVWWDDDASYLLHWTDYWLDALTIPVGAILKV